MELPKKLAPIDLGVLKPAARSRLRPHTVAMRPRILDLAFSVLLPRKEVIQPHVPVRLPCYDFVPVVSLTLDACLPCGFAWRLQVLPTPMT